MWGITDLLIVGGFLLIAYAVVALLVRAFWPERAEYEQPMGDATDTPNVIHMTRRANHRRGL